MMFDPENLTLTYSSHSTREEGMCLMEAVAFMAGESHSDHPKCACPILAAYARTINDRMGEGAEGDALRAKHLLPIAQKWISLSEREILREKLLGHILNNRKVVRTFSGIGEKALFEVSLDEYHAMRFLFPELFDYEPLHKAVDTDMRVGHFWGLPVFLKTET